MLTKNSWITVPIGVPGQRIVLLRCCREHQQRAEALQMTCRLTLRCVRAGVWGGPV